MVPAMRLHVRAALPSLTVFLATLLGACGWGGPVELPAGFSGTETLTGRLEGGSIEAREWGHGCTGFVSAEPDHEVMSASTLPYARFVVNGGALDTTLVLQLSDGTFRCNDDGDGRHPVVEGPLPAGLTKVWVGGFRASAEGDYRLGISTVRDMSAASLAAP
jgi:hypothetical protein